MTRRTPDRDSLERLLRSATIFSQCAEKLSRSMKLSPIQWVREQPDRYCPIGQRLVKELNERLALLVSIEESSQPTAQADSSSKSPNSPTNTPPPSAQPVSHPAA